MATTDYDFSATRSNIIRRALRIVGGITLGETPSAEQVDQSQQILNSIVKFWQADHLFLWTLKTLTITTVNGTVSYALSTDPSLIAIDAAYYTDNSADKRIEVLSYRDYLDIQKKAQTGAPLSVSIDAQATPTIYVYPTPDAAYTITYTGIAKLKDWDSESSVGDFPVRFIEPLIYSLAADLSDEYGLSLAERAMLKREAAQKYTTARRSDRNPSDSDFVKGAY